MSRVAAKSYPACQDQGKAAHAVAPRRSRHLNPPILGLEELSSPQGR